MKYERIESHDKLEVGKSYWLRCKTFGSFDVAKCEAGLIGEGDQKKIAGQWVSPDHHEHAFMNFDFFGPIPTPTIETIYLCHRHGGQGFVSDCDVCHRFKDSQQPAGQE